MQTQTYSEAKNYMSPEVIKGEAYSFGTYVWSLGCGIHELTALQTLFQSSCLNDFIQKIIYSAIPSHYSNEFNYSAKLRVLEFKRKFLTS